MRTSVALAIWPWLGRFEGLYLSDGSLFQWLGLDKKGRPVTALGVDLPSPSAMGAIVWRKGPKPTDVLATFEEVAIEWHRVKAMQSHAGEGGASQAFRSSAYLFYDVDSLFKWCRAKAASLEVYLRHSIPNWDSIPALAQIARLRTPWADGPGIAWPHLDAAIESGDWDTAARECLPSDMASQTSDYRCSYYSVQTLYLLCKQFSGEELPTPLPVVRAPPPLA